MTRPDPDQRLVSRAEDHLFAFLRQLHVRGLVVSTPKQLDFFAAIDALPPTTTGQLYWIGVATLVTSEPALLVYDGVFQQFFGRADEAVPVLDERPEQPPDDDNEPTGSPGEREAADIALEHGGRNGLAAGRLSPESVVRFPATSPDARQILRRIAGELPRAVPTTRSRRSRPGGRRRRVDLRATYHQSLRTHGEVMRLHWRHRPPHERRVLVLVDVSGSMKQYSADYLRFAHTMVATCARVEVFTFGTRLTRVTPALRTPETDTALAALAGLVLDAEGGTQIGESLRTFLGSARFVTMSRGALVLVLSDGLERGDCTGMVAATRRLSQLAHRLCWWSPLACDPAYRPLTRGMSAVRPELDALTGVRDLETALAAVVSAFGRDPRVHR
ncbi:VWA domain-containing protein [Actinoplanes sp. TRM 88003]|uniref:VWA domain-containing protein n=1 Tax=Paractinoplanes aksuensis TaxID=2939490 RepID=A0ABT1DV56_9ACTN|nr:VWA domain-containing protein [Actinoplanes aksuensis]MCO8273936.1 VWA domain-containing protein [Actinoplanes aksuensis]